MAFTSGFTALIGAGFNVVAYDPSRDAYDVKDASGIIHQIPGSAVHGVSHHQAFQQAQAQQNMLGAYMSAPQFAGSAPMLRMYAVPAGTRYFTCPPAVEPEPLVEEHIDREIVAYRGWVLSHGVLVACNTRYGWSRDGMNSAVCIHGGSHKAPHELCSCGFYATKTLDYARQAQHDYSSHAHEYGIIVWGSVALSGTIIEHESGYRAERARVLDILGPEEGIKAYMETAL